MLGHLGKKLGAAFLTLFLVALGTFFLGRAVPGGPFDGEKAQPPHIKEWQEKKYGFDKPPLLHFGQYLADLARGDFGVSLKYVDRPVARILAESFPVSLRLGFLALLTAILIGLPFGIAGALRPNSWIDFSASFLSVAGVTLPSFLLGAFLVLLFSQHLNWLPPARLDGPEYYILPVLTLAIRPAAILASLTRATLLEELSRDHIRTARAKGLSATKIILRHGVRNTLVPVVAVMGPVAANILTGSFVVEHFFAIPGIAKHFIHAVNNRDVFLMMGVTLLFSSILIGINLITELFAPVLDPRAA